MSPLFSIRARQRGHGATPIIVFIGIVVLSVVFFFALTWPSRMERKKRAAALAEESAITPPKQTTSSAPVTPTPPNTTEEPEQTPAPSTTPTRFASPRALVTIIAEKLANNDVETARTLIGTEALPPEKAAFLHSIYQEVKLQSAPANAVREIGDLGERYRWAIPILDRTAHATTGEIKSIDGTPAAPENVPFHENSGASTEVFLNAPRLEIDVARDQTAGWKITDVHFPESLRQAVARQLGSNHIPTTIAQPADEQNDPLKIAEHFLLAVLKQDYAVARAVTDTEKVTRKKVAGLCILFEEGRYVVADQRPLNATAVGNDHSWVIVKLRSGIDGQESEFGLELQKLPTGAWQVAGVNFSKMLATYAAASGAHDGVPYTPIVQSPGGGESLAVYFDFDESGLVPRAQRQLEIVANLLRDDPRRKLRLSGHADAVGSDAYNRQLSAARAYAVKNFLSELGVSPEQITTEGLGTLQPLDPNTKPDGSDNPEGRSRNRRTEIFLDF